ncbi:hypothetical protein FRC18_011315 [Serendipita sp. 400]|nr:hypothetical protein FRC18_011315 [Serendipita sp. 400]
MPAFGGPTGPPIGTIHVGTEMQEPLSHVPASPASPSWAILASPRTSCWKGFSSIRYLFIFGASLRFDDISAVLTYLTRL